VTSHKVDQRKSQRFSVVVGVLVSGLLVALFFVTRPLDLARHNAVVQQLNSLQSNDARLGEAVLQLNFSLSNSYDEVSAIASELRATTQALQRGDLASELRKDEAFRIELESLDRGLKAKMDALEAFKSRNAVLKNSLIYLRRARDDLLKDLPPGSVVHETLDELVELVLLNRVQGLATDTGVVEGKIAILQKEIAKRSGAVQRKLLNILGHVRQIDVYEKEMPTVVSQIKSSNEFGGLQRAYGQLFDAQQSRATAFRMFLLVVSLALIILVVRVLLQLRAQSQRLKLSASVFANASEGITITDLDGTILDVNSAFTTVTGYSRAEVIGHNPRLLQSGRHGPDFYAAMWRTIRESGRWQGEVWNRRKSGEVYPEWLTITAASAQRDDVNVVSHYVATFSDISARKKSEADIYQLAFFDPLTGLPNRRQIMDRLQHAKARQERDGGNAALLFIDVDNFKTVNDVNGHDVGDLLLVDIARRIQGATRQFDLVGRLSGDEFVVMLDRLPDNLELAASQASAVADKLQQSLRRPYTLKGLPCSSTCSMGISLFSAEHTVDELLKYADTAMYQAKEDGRDEVRFFDPAMQKAIEERSALELDLRQAIRDEQFVLFYQVQTDSEGRAVGAEALIRWNHPTKGLLSPAAFITQAEETRLILPIGEWVLQEACRQIKRWSEDDATRHLVLGVNVSAHQFKAGLLVRQIEEQLFATGIEPHLLKLEITESMLLDDVEKAISTMRQIKGLGVSFSIDDFGTGYSSLQYLKRLPLDQIKIDQSFVRDITTDSSDQAIVRTIVAMAQSLQLSTIAEGVETADQKTMLKACGCEDFQGYLLGRPVPVSEFEARLKA
jgi:diguanylate cyclase (GGDEF)-like protein/PAS domain S-box-containing protein